MEEVFAEHVAGVEDYHAVMGMLGGEEIIRCFVGEDFGCKVGDERVGKGCIRVGGCEVSIILCWCIVSPLSSTFRRR